MSDEIFGVSAKALELCEGRSVLLSNNIVNTSTPHFKARDIDFNKVLKDVGNESALQTTHANHISAAGDTGAGPTLYRVPMQKSLDGNTVDEEMERKNFIDNALHYQVNLTFIKNKTEELMKAIKGE